VSFELEAGRTLGIVGESGCGKTVLSRSLLRLSPVAGGRVIFDGRDLLTMDESELRARAVQCYGIGPMVDEEDAAKGFGRHSDQERMLEDALDKFVRFNWDVVTALAGKK